MHLSRCPYIGGDKGRDASISCGSRRIISGLTGVPVVHGVLKRVRSTPQQEGKSKTERADNVQDAFQVVTELESDIAGRRLVLIDTSGATVDACARALSRAGAGYVDVLVFARVVAAARPPI